MNWTKIKRIYWYDMEIQIKFTVLEDKIKIKYAI